MSKWLLAAVVLGFAFPCAATTYTFKTALYGNIQNFTQPCSGGDCRAYDPSMRVTGSITTSVPIPPNSDIRTSDITNLVTSFSFNDGVRTYSSDDPRSGWFRVTAATDSDGHIVGVTFNLQFWKLPGPNHAMYERVGSLYTEPGRTDMFTNGVCAKAAVRGTCPELSNDLGSSSYAEAYGNAWFDPPSAWPIPVTRKGMVTVLEYYHVDWDHYFMTANPVEQALLGKPPFEDWVATGRSFLAFANDPSQTDTSVASPVCRFFNASFAGKSSHFYGLPMPCAQTLFAYPDWILEDKSAFRMGIPNEVTGACPAATPVPVYRLYNEGQGGAPNHRFVTNPNDRDAMNAKGWAPEGAGGQLGVAFCGPAAR